MVHGGNPGQDGEEEQFARWWVSAAIELYFFPGVGWGIITEEEYR